MVIIEQRTAGDQGRDRQARKQLRKKEIQEIIRVEQIFCVSVQLTQIKIDNTSLLLPTLQKQSQFDFIAVISKEEIFESLELFKAKAHSRFEQFETPRRSQPEGLKLQLIRIKRL